MAVTPWSLVGAIWTVLLVVWVVAAVTTKRTVRRESGPARLVQLGLNVSAWVLMTNRVPVRGALAARFVPDTPAVAWAGVALALAGAAFALWARFTIGRNWSGTITLKSEHELITRGPYSIVRHPIYTGLPSPREGAHPVRAVVRASEHGVPQHRPRIPEPARRPTLQGPRPTRRNSSAVR